MSLSLVVNIMFANCEKFDPVPVAFHRVEAEVRPHGFHIGDARLFS